MSEPLAERLSRFTLDATGLDRDAVLFAAGRASARPNWKWKTLAAALAISQVLTLVGLWPRPMPSSAPSPVVVQQQPASALPEEEIVPPPAGAWTPRTDLLSMDLDRPAPPSEEPMVPPEPPLRAFGPLPAAILN
jgi:hypothetical protein